MHGFIRRPREAPTVPVTPEFGVRVVLREGDKIVRRDAEGEVHVMRISQAATYALDDLMVDSPE